MGVTFETILCTVKPGKQGHAALLCQPPPWPNSMRGKKFRGCLIPWRFRAYRELYIY